MTAALAGTEAPEWTPPEGICFARIDNQTGKRIFTDKPHSFVAPFRCGKEPEVEGAASSSSLDEAEKRGGI